MNLHADRSSPVIKSLLQAFIFLFLLSVAVTKTNARNGTVIFPTSDVSAHVTSGGTDSTGRRVPSHKILPQHLKVVRDPWSATTIAPDEIARVKNASRRSVEESGSGDSLSFAVLNFRVGNTRLEREYMDNARTLDMIHRRFSYEGLLTAMDFITITAAASPEGNTEANEKLAAERALAVKSYIMWKYPFVDRDRIFTFSVGEDWIGLYRMVADDPKTPNRNEILEIIGSNLDSDTKRSRLKLLDGGRTYRYIADNMLPHLRGAAACMIYYKEGHDPNMRPDTVFIDRLIEVEKVVEREVPVVRTDTIIIDRFVEVEKIVEKEPPMVEHKMDNDGNRYFCAIKTNMLYDAVLLPDLAFEFSLPRRWSVEIGGQWSWWNSEDPDHYYHRIQSAGIELRKWLGRPERTPLTGHFLGLYVMGGNYDIKFGQRGVLCDDISWSAGVTYGYSTPIGRRLNLEFSVGIGYLWGEYMKYTWDPEFRCYPWEGTYQRNYIGPTKAEISLVWLIGSGKNNIGRR